MKSWPELEMSILTCEYKNIVAHEESYSATKKEQTANILNKTDEYPKMLRSQAQKCILGEPIYIKFKEKEI